MADRRRQDDEAEAREIARSPLEGTVHAEALALFQDSANSIFFAKAQQWKTVGATVVIFVVIVGLAKFISTDREFILVLKLIVIVSGVVAIFIIGIYQVWQHTEARKIAAVEVEFSSVWRQVRRIKSKLEADLHRYFLLLAMIAVIIVGGFTTILSLGELTPNL